MLLLAFSLFVFPTVFSIQDFLVSFFCSPHQEDWNITLYMYAPASAVYLVDALRLKVKLQTEKLGSSPALLQASFHSAKICLFMLSTIQDNNLKYSNII